MNSMSTIKVRKKYPERAIDCGVPEANMMGVAAGIMVAVALEAASELAKEGIYAQVLDMFTILPLDEAAVIAAAKKTGAVVTAENCNVIGGLGSAVAESLAKNHPTPMRFVGVNDQFGQVDEEGYLRKALRKVYELTPEKIIKMVREVVKLKLLK